MSKSKQTIIHGSTKSTKDTRICILCSREFEPESYILHLSDHSQSEIELLRKLRQKTKYMSLEELRKFVSDIDIKSYKLAQASLNSKKVKLKAI